MPWVLIAAALLGRSLFLAFAPTLAVSVDLRHWLDVGLILKAGGNPYVSTPYLNWPPLWMGILWTLLKVNAWTHIPFFRLIQFFLILTDCLVIALLSRGLKRRFPSVAVELPICVGLALNPASIFLACQHSNFDALVGLFVLLFCFYLSDFERNHAHTDWYKACLFLGLGILTKTVPLILVPLLLPGLKRLDLRRRLAGLLLALGPATLGVGILYVRNPVEIAANVLSYRSQSGWFGLTGLLGPLAPLYQAASPLVLAGAAAWAGLRALKGPQRTEDILLTAALLLVCVPALGPGYAPQYIGWFLPLLIALYVVDKTRSWRLLLGGLGAIIAATYSYEYALCDSHGAFLLHMVTDPTWEEAGRRYCARLRKLS
ncbi:MAG: hypothetical protein AAB036_11720 [Elusimicrobiota bacterium]